MTTAKQTRRTRATKTTEPKGSQIQKAPPSAKLAGIEFADAPTADPRPNTQTGPEVSPPEYTEQSVQANQDAARRAIERMNVSNQDERRQHRQVEVKVPEPTKEELAKINARLKIYRVIGNHRITRGASTYNLPAGKQITNRDYDIESLQAQGVELKEV